MFLKQHIFWGRLLSGYLKLPPDYKAEDEASDRNEAKFSTGFVIFFLIIYVVE